MERLGIDDLAPLRFRGITQAKQLVAVQPSDSHTLRLYGDQRLKRLKPGDLTPAELALFAAPPQGLLFECNAQSSSLAVSLTAREPPAPDRAATTPAGESTTIARGIAAWIQDCRLESWYQTNGGSRHLATYDLQNTGRKRLDLTLPPEVAPDAVRGVWVDGQSGQWRTTATRPGRLLSVELPVSRRSVCVTVEWASSGPLLGMAGSLVAAMPEPELPVFGRHWIAWLPPGYENADSDAAAPSAGAEGWTSHRADIAAGTPVALRYAQTDSMRLLWNRCILAGSGPRLVGSQAMYGGGGRLRGIVGRLRRGGIGTADRVRSDRVWWSAGRALLPGISVDSSRFDGDRQTANRRRQSSRQCGSRQHDRNGRAGRAGDFRRAVVAILLHGRCA